MLAASQPALSLDFVLPQHSNCIGQYWTMKSDGAVDTVVYCSLSPCTGDWRLSGHTYCTVELCIFFRVGKLQKMCVSLLFIKVL